MPPHSGPVPLRTSGEVVTYVREGSLVYQDSNNVSAILRAGEFHRVTLGGDFRFSETNESSTDWTYVFQVWLTPEGDCQAGHESKRFGAADRRHGLCLIASPDGREGSLTLHQDCFLYSAILPKGRHLVHSLAAGRMACLHVVDGEVQLGELSLAAGDTALLNDEPSVSFSSDGGSEVLLLDLGKPATPTNGKSGRKGTR